MSKQLSDLLLIFTADFVRTYSTYIFYYNNTEYYPSHCVYVSFLQLHSLRIMPLAQSTSQLRKTSESINGWLYIELRKTSESINGWLYIELRKTSESINGWLYIELRKTSESINGWLYIELRKTSESINVGFI